MGALTEDPTSGAESTSPASDPTRAPLVDAALDYAQQGVKVLPCREVNTAPPGEDNSKAPYNRHGLTEASTDPKRIWDWWIQWPEALIGGVVPDGLCVIDLDPRKVVLTEEKLAAAAEFCSEHGGNPDAYRDHLRAHRLEARLEKLMGAPLPDTRRCYSGRGDGGAHYLFKRPPGQLTTSRLNRHIQGVDLKDAATGYTILPPSPHPETGKPYRWDHRHPVAALPEACGSY
jgi:hypothetical protein